MISFGETVNMHIKAWLVDIVIKYWLEGKERKPVVGCTSGVARQNDVR